MSNFGSRVKAAREALGFNGSQFARATDIERANLWRIEAGKHHPTLGNAVAIAKTLGVSLDYLCGMPEPTVDGAEVDKRLEVMRQIEELKGQL